MLAPASFGSPPGTQPDPSLASNPQLGLWNDMTDVASQYWNDMSQVDWAEFIDDPSGLSGYAPLSGARDPHLENPRSMDSSFPGPTNSSEVLSST